MRFLCIVMRNTIVLVWGSDSEVCWCGGSDSECGGSDSELGLLVWRE